MERQIAWTPEGGDPQTMAVLIPPQTQPLTQEAYQDHLRRRYARLAREAREAGGDPLAMAQQRMAEWDGLTPNNSRDVPRVLATQSETLMTNLPMDQFPVQPNRIKENGASREAINLMQFGDLLTAIYPTV